MAETSFPRVNLQKAIAGAQLPALPQSAVRLLELSQDPANGPAEFAAPIEADPGLSGQVLRFVNSSYFGFAREISNVKLAITLVGIRTIKNFALWSAVFSLLPNPKCGPFDLKSLWQDSLRRALCARELARLLSVKETEEAFATALLQDMAIPILAKEAPQAYATLLEARQGGKLRLSDLEQQHFGWTHGQAAAQMARGWNLPESFANLIEEHQAVERWASSPASNPEKLAVALSALLPSAIDAVWCDAELFEQYYGKTMPPGSPPIADLLAKVDEGFGEFAPILKLSTPARSLVQTYQETAAAVV